MAGLLFVRTRVGGVPWNTTIYTVNMHATAGFGSVDGNSSHSHLETTGSLCCCPGPQDPTGFRTLS